MKMRMQEEMIKVFLSGTMEIDEQGVLQIGGVSSEELREEFGTPLLVLDEKDMRKRANRYHSALRESYPGDFQILYASKALANRTVFKIMRQEGLGLDVVSGGELFKALRAGVDPDCIHFHGNNKQDHELKMALEAGIGGFFVDNLQEARALNELAGEMDVRPAVMLRVKPGIEAHTHEYMVTGQPRSKFGLGLTDGRARRLVEMITGRGELSDGDRLENLEFEGLHAHIGSQIYEQEAYSRLIGIMFEFMAELREETGIICSRLNLGGGLGIRQAEGDPEVSIGQHVRNISDGVAEESRRLDYPLPELMLEPGRSLVGPAGTTLYTVGSIKPSPGGKKYVAVDGGMSDNIRPALYDAEYSALLAGKADKSPQETVAVAGRCCESGDILIDEVELPPAESGDLLAVPATGAYTRSLASNYNEIPRPAVVLVHEGQASPVERRESYEDLMRRDMMPARFDEN